MVASENGAHVISNDKYLLFKRNVGKIDYLETSLQYIR